MLLPSVLDVFGLSSGVEGDKPSFITLPVRWRGGDRLKHTDATIRMGYHRSHSPPIPLHTHIYIWGGKNAYRPKIERLNKNLPFEGHTAPLTHPFIVWGTYTYS